jgi:hypothetical protein
LSVASEYGQPRSIGSAVDQIRDFAEGLALKDWSAHQLKWPSEATVRTGVQRRFICNVAVPGLPVTAVTGAATIWTSVVRYRGLRVVGVVMTDNPFRHGRIQGRYRPKRQGNRNQLAHEFTYSVMSGTSPLLLSVNIL